MGHSIAELFWKRESPLLRGDFVRGLTFLFVLSGLALLNSVAFGLYQGFVFSSDSHTENLRKAQFYLSAFSFFQVDLFLPALFLGCLTLFVKRARAIRAQPWIGVAAGLIFFAALRSATLFVAYLYTFVARPSLIDDDPNTPVVMYIVLGVLCLFGLISLLIFLLCPDGEKGPANGMKRSDGKLNAVEFAKKFWLIFFISLAAYVGVLVPVVAIAISTNLSQSLTQNIIYICAGIVSIVGQIALIVTMVRRLRDAGLSPWLVLWVNLGVWATAALLIGGIYLRPPFFITHTLFVVGLIVLALPSLGMLALLSLPSKMEREETLAVISQNAE